MRKEIVHNKHVVEQLRERGAIFVDNADEVPEGETVVFSAHGVSPAVHAKAAERNLQTIDATCPLVTKVHVEAKKFAADGYTIVLIGHDGHEEVEGTMGEAPDAIVLVETVDDVASLEVPDPETRRLHLADHALGRRDQRDHRRAAREVPEDRRSAHRRHLLRDDQPPGRRQAARRRVRPGARDRLEELVELEPPGRRHARPRRRLLPDRQRHAGRGASGSRASRVVGITSGASAPEELVQNLVQFFRDRGTTDVSELEVIQENVRFMLPKEIREALDDRTRCRLLRSAALAAPAASALGGGELKSVQPHARPGRP